MVARRAPARCCKGSGVVLAAKGARLPKKVKAKDGDDKATAGCGGWLRLKEIDACAALAGPSSKINMLLSWFRIMKAMCA